MSGQVVLYFEDQADALRFALAAGQVMAGEGGRVHERPGAGDSPGYAHPPRCRERQREETESGTRRLDSTIRASSSWGPILCGVE